MGQITSHKWITFFSKTFAPGKWTLQSFEQKNCESNLQQQNIWFSKIEPARDKMVSVGGYKKRLNIPSLVKYKVLKEIEGVQSCTATSRKFVNKTDESSHIWVIRKCYIEMVKKCKTYQLPGCC